MSNQWFDISNEGWRRMNAGRPPHELVKELVQNILDEDFKEASITFGMKGEEFHLSVEDDVNGGISDSSLVTTVFLTGKEDSPEKRGRKGRGLKEFLSVCRRASVETAGKTIYFNDDGTRAEKPNNRTSGTKISCVIVEEGWDAKARTTIQKYLSRIILRNGDIFVVNGTRIAKRLPTMTLPATLETHVIENGIQTSIQRKTDVCLYDKAGKKGWLFEMGIPVMETDMPWDVDVCQRIPMNDNRNEVSVQYVKSVKRAIITARVNVITRKELLGWAQEALDYYIPWNVRGQLAQIIMERDPKTCVLRCKNNRYNDKAEQKGKEVFDIRGMSQNILSLLSYTVEYADRYVREVEKNAKPVEVEATELEKSFMDVQLALVKKATGMKVKGQIVEKEADIEGHATIATYSKTVDAMNPKKFNRTISWNRKALGRKGMGKMFFNDPYSVQALDTLIHELAHEKSSEHTTMTYVDAVTYYGAKIAIALMQGKGSFVKTKPVKKHVSRPKPGNTTMDKLREVLPSDVYMNLNTIYQNMGAETTGQKAGIRGVLNRNCLADNSVFERHSQGGSYKLRTA